MSTYDKIAELCKERGISVTGLEAELGFGRGSIGKMKKGGSTSIARLQKIADYFGKDLKYFSDENEDVQTDEHEPYYYDKETLEMAQVLFKNKELHLLFDAAKDIEKDDLFFVYSLIQRMKRTNKDE